MRNAPTLNHKARLHATCSAVILAFCYGCQTAPAAPDQPSHPAVVIDESPAEAEPVATIDESPGADAWQAVLALRDAGESEEVSEAVQAYIREYGDHPENNARVLEGMTMIADDLEDRNDRAGSVKWYTKVVAEFEARGLEPKTRAAHYAAKAQFMLAEFEFEEWSKTAYAGSLKEHKGKLKEQERALTRLMEEFQTLMRGT